MKELIILSVFIVALVFCLAGIVIGVWTAIAMICEARDKKKVRVKNYSSEADFKLSMKY